MIRYRPCGACGVLIDTLTSGCKHWSLKQHPDITIQNRREYRREYQRRRRALEKEEKQKVSSAFDFINNWRKENNGS